MPGLCPVRGIVDAKGDVVKRRSEFPKSVKLAAWERCGGICECGCGRKILRPEYDHRLEDYVGGSSELSNCVVLDVKCHKLKTAESRPEIDKTRRIYEKRAGVRQKQGFRKPPPGYDPWRRTMK
jgi:5-methylcytosine-specific restriction endonuclease McrA